MSDSKYFVKSQNPKYPDDIVEITYSDTIYQGGTDLGRYEYEISKDYLIVSTEGGESTLGAEMRIVVKGRFNFNGYGLISGTLLEAIMVTSTGYIEVSTLKDPVFIVSPIFDIMSNFRVGDNAVFTKSMGEYSKFFPVGWSNRLFEDDLVSIDKTSSSSGSSSSSKGKTFNGTTKIDKIIGTSKDDIIIGGGAADRLTGGKGKDRFVYNTINDSRPGSRNRDTITDFNGGEGDQIDLQKIDGNPKVKGNQNLRFIGSKAFGGKEGEVRFAGGVLQIDNNLDRKADMEIALTGVTSFSSNFLVL